MKVHQILLAVTLAGALVAPGASADQEGKAKGHFKAKAAKAAKDERKADREALPRGPAAISPCASATWITTATA